MKYFFSCDWGTSSFRLRLVDAGNRQVLSEIRTRQGIAMTFDAWKNSGQAETERLYFYQNYLLAQVKNIANTILIPIDNLPIMLTGMASSSIGMMELPYKKLPFHCDGSDLVVHAIAGSDKQSNKTIIISGAKSDEDVMRGEETILVGCDIPNENNLRLLIFPGTHSKHVLVQNGIVQNFSTYMTGELFDLLSNKSILVASVTKGDAGTGSDSQAFADGVKEGASSNILNSFFHVRTNQVLKKMPGESNYYFLSGLLIGQELKDIFNIKLAGITLVCSGELKELYAKALGMLGPDLRIDFENADEALINGQVKILEQAV